MAVSRTRGSRSSSARKSKKARSWVGVQNFISGARAAFGDGAVAARATLRATRPFFSASESALPMMVLM
jgi:hypothetical protein